MKEVERLIQQAEILLPGVKAPEGEQDPRWQAIIEISEYIESEPEEVWRFIRKWGAHRYEDLRAAIATCALEHLLQYDFVEYFPKVKRACRESKRFADTFRGCWKFGQANRPEFSKEWDELALALRAN